MFHSGIISVLSLRLLVVVYLPHAPTFVHKYGDNNGTKWCERTYKLSINAVKCKWLSPEM